MISDEMNLIHSQLKGEENYIQSWFRLIKIEFEMPKFSLNINLIFIKNITNNL